MERECESPGCRKSTKRGRRYCEGHRGQLKRGDLLRSLGDPVYRPSLIPGAKPKVACDQTADGCHIPRRKPLCDGYIALEVDGRCVMVHRYVWEQENDPIPEGMLIDHICRNRACCNTDHLRIVTPRVNAIENSVGPTAINAAKTHCVHGHEFTRANTLLRKHGRGCRTCHQINARNRRAKLRLLRAAAGG